MKTAHPRGCTCALCDDGPTWLEVIAMVLISPLYLLCAIALAIGALLGLVDLKAADRERWGLDS